MDLTQQAISASLSKDWKLAIKLNLSLIKENPQDVDALNRLAKAYLYSGFKAKAQTAYNKVLKIDKFNPIALKGLENIKTYKVERRKDNLATVDYSSAFLEEPGTTKNLNLIRLGDAKILTRLQPGDEVTLQAREHCVSVVNSDNEYLGRLPDDISSRLRPLIKSGNKYQAWIRNLDIQRNDLTNSTVKIFIREVSRSKKYSQVLSFPSTEKLSYAAFTPPEFVHTDRPRTNTTEDEDSEEYTPEEVLESDSESESSLKSSSDNDE